MGTVEYGCVNVFFFQAEDGIRDWSVTGVQTCALPIWLPRAPHWKKGEGAYYVVKNFRTADACCSMGLGDRLGTIDFFLIL